MPEVNLTPDARRDLIRIDAYIRQQDPERADRFRRRSQETMSRISESPYSGAPFEFAPEGQEIRWAVIARFRKYIFLYQPIPLGINVIRVMHTSQDISIVFTDE
ncbi:type II toxin-antitoxin system RelE/ParE family toxin [Zavarzinella formosa]|uniref:type II toxin-antitoxin system RelE/ParE family toxin n=1 Tax=Zavarzinella formosa TaxID=360055 RepID=UPI000382F16E|nr:type II toxin-antitoxin system RelE/ParE family toxin [Zavarzinella formosa]